MILASITKDKDFEVKVTHGKHSFFISIAHWSVEEGGAIMGKVAKRQRQNPRQKWKTAKCAEEQDNESIDSFQIII